MDSLDWCFLYFPYSFASISSKFALELPKALRKAFYLTLSTLKILWSPFALVFWHPLLLTTATMFVLSTFKLIILSSLAFLTHNAPVMPREPPQYPAFQKRASYSVVDVGGNSINPSPSISSNVENHTVTQVLESTKTVTASPQGRRGPQATIISTKLMPGSVAATVTLTPSATAATLTRSIPYITSQTSFVTIVDKSTYYDQTTVAYNIADPVQNNKSICTFATSSTTESTIRGCSKTRRESSQAPLTGSSHPAVPESQPSSKRLNYDDGLWHTSYPIYNTTSSTIYLASQIATSADTSPVVFETRAPWRPSVLMQQSWTQVYTQAENYEVNFRQPNFQPQGKLALYWDRPWVWWRMVSDFELPETT